MKKLLLFFFFCFQFVVAQNNKVYYDFQIIPDASISKQEFFGEEFSKGVQGAKYLNFELYYNDTISVFKLKEILDNENNEISSAIAYSGLSKNIFTLKKYNYSNNEGTFLPDDKYLIKTRVINNWVLTNETKLIDGYLCYKATTELIKDVKYLNEVFHFPVLAWYCPQIPSAFGPAGYGQLPGLILELQENLKVFTVKKIEFKKDNAIIKLPKKGELISEAEYDEIIFKSLKENIDN